MPFDPSAETLNALHGWLDRETWHDSHALDDGRFFQFVMRCWIDGRVPWDEDAVQERIILTANELHPGLDQEAVTTAAELHVDDGTVILQFLSHLQQRNELHMLQADSKRTQGTNE